jgi:putative transposase
MEILRLYGIRQSFSRVGMPGDNAWSESFFATLKKECIHGNHFATREELRETVFSWIESFYNNRRVQARLGYRSPREYTALLMEAAKMEQSSSQPSNNLVHALA